MDRHAIEGRLTDIFHDLFADDSIVLRSDMTADDIEGWDSFTNLNLIVATEAAFKIKFSFDEIESLKNVGALIATVGKKIAEAEPQSDDGTI